MTLRVYIGWDWRDATAFKVARASLQRHSSIPLDVVALTDMDLRRRGVYWRSYHVDPRGQMWDDRDGRPFSTAFSFARFAVPIIEKYGTEPVLFMDPDMLVRADIAELLDEADMEKAVNCVQHDHRPNEAQKMDGVLQTVYDRKNWSSLMLLLPDRCRRLTKYVLNNDRGSNLHGLCWVADEEIGALDERWNWLEGWSDPDIEPAIVHYTRGTPDMEGHEDVPYADEWWAYAKQVGEVT